MANSYKNIIIVPNVNAANGVDPYVSFRGANTAVNTEIALKVYPDSSGTLSFEGTSGQLFSITNELTGTIFSVNDISGIPSLEIDANGIIQLAQFDGNVRIGNVSYDGSSFLSVANSANIGSLRIRNYGEVIAANGMWTGLTIPAGKANVSVYANSGSTLAASGLNFVNTSTVTVTVSSGSAGNANISFTGTAAPDEYARTLAYIGL